jgi:membrane-associated phospholipid phosphatase
MLQAPALHRMSRAVAVLLLLVPSGTASAQQLAELTISQGLSGMTATSDPLLSDLLQAEPPPKPRRTGIRAFVGTIASDVVALPRRRSTWVILAIGSGAAALGHRADDSVNSRLTGSRGAERFFAAGQWAGASWVQTSTAAGLYVVGRYVLPPAEGTPKTNKVSHLGFDLLRAQLLSQAFVRGIKNTVRRDRPMGDCCSFPSGHAANAFAAASVLERHFGYRAAWPTLLLATYVGASRLHENKHYLSDVLFGSAVGMSIGWTVVGRHGRSVYTIAPMPVRDGIAIALVRIQ